MYAFNPAAFTSTTAGTGGGAITYQWQSSTTSAVAGFSNIGGATSETYNAPAVAVVTWFRRTAISTLNGVPCSDNSNVLFVAPNAINPGAIAGDQIGLFTMLDPSSLYQYNSRYRRWCYHLPMADPFSRKL